MLLSTKSSGKILPTFKSNLNGLFLPNFWKSTKSLEVDKYFKFQKRKIWIPETKAHKLDVDTDFKLIIE